MPFPTDFTWGAAAASYQIEGAHDADGKGPSVWDMMCRWEGRIHEGQTGDVACDHYNRYREDVALMQRIGLKGYRLSLSWPRIIPEGVGRVNEAGLAFYDRLVDELLGAGIQPWVTLFHWDFPLELFRRGGWLNRDSAEWFGEYAGIVADRLGDRVRCWMTHNEPQVFIGLGHGSGVHAPGLKLPFSEQLVAGHHAMLAHGRAVQALRDRTKQPPRIGWAPVGVIRYPAGNDPAHVDAARRATYACTERHVWNLTWFSDAVLKGAYPADALEAWGDEAPRVRSGDMELMAQPLDFFGVNIYNALPVRAADSAAGYEQVLRYDGFPITLFGWPIEPDSLYWGPRFIHERYGLPVVVTENGMSNPDVIDLDGRVRDPQRIDFTRRYLLRLEDAINDGIPVEGYFHWSIMDNFEWAEGYKHRFGLIFVDYPTSRRVLKDSAHWYSRVISSNGQTLHEPV